MHIILICTEKCIYNINYRVKKIELRVKCVKVWKNPSSNFNEEK
jgi:hypothetical protein